MRWDMYPVIFSDMIAVIWSVDLLSISWYHYSRLYGSASGVHLVNFVVGFWETEAWSQDCCGNWEDERWLSSGCKERRHFVLRLVGSVNHKYYVPVFPCLIPCCVQNVTEEKYARLNFDKEIAQHHGHTDPQYLQLWLHWYLWETQAALFIPNYHQTRARCWQCHSGGIRLLHQGMTTPIITRVCILYWVLLSLWGWS